MKNSTVSRTYAGRFLVLAAAGTLLLQLVGMPTVSEAAGGNKSVIIQASSAAQAAALVRDAGGTVTRELGVIHSVAAELTAEQEIELTRNAGVQRVWDNGSVELSGKPNKGPTSNSPKQVVDTYYPTHLGADQLHSEGINGSGVTVAVLDSGIFADNGLTKKYGDEMRLLAVYDALTGSLSQKKGAPKLIADEFGHGSHVTSIAVSSRLDETGTYNGMAPNADLVVINAFDELGSSSYAVVIGAIDWVVANKNAYGIRVLNCSFSAQPQSYYWDDPLNQAVMAAWRAGIVVVASAGNRGPDAMTIGVPGNVPYVSPSAR